ncbi:hypothetical protein D3C75_1349030 [compost metagenome]
MNKIRIGTATITAPAAKLVNSVEFWRLTISYSPTARVYFSDERRISLAKIKSIHAPVKIIRLT